MKKNLLYYCPICGNIITVLEAKNGKISCCGKEMLVLEANTVDASLEKHVPIVEKNNNNVIVKIGQTMHPMTEEHSIRWVALISSDIAMIKRFHQNDNPEALFPYIKDSTVYAYCNLHGLWASKIS